MGRAASQGSLPDGDVLGRQLVFLSHYLDYRDQTGAIFEGGVAAHFPLIPASIGGKGAPERVWGQSVSGNFFGMLDVPMMLYT